MTANTADTDSADAAAAHSAVTLELAQKESAEHMEGMQGVYESMRHRCLTIKVYALDDPNAPSLVIMLKPFILYVTVKDFII
jgi:hypothetical protein